MFDLDKWLEVFSTLRRNKLRTLMTASGVFWGILMLVTMLGFGTGLEAGVTKNMFGFVSNSVYVWGGRTRMAFKGLQPGRWIHYTDQDTEAIEREIEGLEAVAPRLQLGGWRDGVNISYGDKAGNFAVMGDVPAEATIDHIRPHHGRFINPLDLDELRKVTVIGEQVTRVLFPDGVDPVGKFVKIRGVYFRVIGVFRSEKPGEQGERANGTLHVPFTTFQHAFNALGTVGWFSLLARPEVEAARIERDVRKLLMRRHSINPQDERALGSYNAGETYGRIERLFIGIRSFIWFVSVATLFAGVLGVSNIMLISVKERTKEIGVRKALGATPWSIVSLVMQESALLTALSGYVGLVVGVAILELVSPAIERSDGPLGVPSIDVGSALIATAILAVAGIIAGVAPASHAAKIQPVEALRSE